MLGRWAGAKAVFVIIDEDDVVRHIDLKRVDNVVGVGVGKDLRVSRLRIGQELRQRTFDNLAAVAALGFQQNEIQAGLGIELNLADEALLQCRIIRAIAGIGVGGAGCSPRGVAVVIGAIDDAVGRAAADDGKDVGVEHVGVLRHGRGGERRARHDRARAGVERPGATLGGAADRPGRGGDIEAGPLRDLVEKDQTARIGHHIAAVEPEIATRLNRRADLGELRGILADRGIVEHGIAEEQHAVRAMRDDVDGGQIGIRVRGEEVGDLIDAIGVGIEHDDFDAGTHTAGQQLPVGRLLIDEHDLGRIVHRGVDGRQRFGHRQSRGGGSARPAPVVHLPGDAAAGVCAAGGGIAIARAGSELHLLERGLVVDRACLAAQGQDAVVEGRGDGRAVAEGLSVSAVVEAQHVAGLQSARDRHRGSGQMTAIGGAHRQAAIQRHRRPGAGIGRVRRAHRQRGRAMHVVASRDRRTGRGTVIGRGVWMPVTVAAAGRHGPYPPRRPALGSVGLMMMMKRCCRGMPRRAVVHDAGLELHEAEASTAAGFLFLLLGFVRFRSDHGHTPPRTRQ